MSRQVNEAGAATRALKMFLFWIVIPGTILVIITGLLLSIAEVSPRSIFSQLPVVSSWVSQEREDEEMTEIVAEKDDEIEHLEQQLQQREADIDELEEEIEQMEEDEANSEEASEAQEDVDTSEELTRIARVYENMRPKQAAEIMGELTNDAIMLHMSGMNDDSRSAILEQMDPERAAEITTLLAD